MRARMPIIDGIAALANVSKNESGVQCKSPVQSGARISIMGFVRSTFWIVSADSGQKRGTQRPKSTSASDMLVKKAHHHLADIMSRNTLEKCVREILGTRSFSRVLQVHLDGGDGT